MSSSDMSDDPDAAMREMMGFNHFGGTKRPKELHQDRKPSPSTGANATSKIPVPVAKRVKTSSDHHSSNTTSASINNLSSPRTSMMTLTPASVLPYTPRTPSSTSQPLLAPEQELTREANITNPDSNEDTETHGLSSRPPTVPEQARALQNHQTAATVRQPDTSSSMLLPSSFAPAFDTRYAYASPANPNISFTRQQLDELARGAGPKNSKGDTIYFKPGFVVDDPWERVRALHEQRKVQDRTGGNWLMIE